MGQRVSYFDNGKFILIVLVVLGHLLRSFINDNQLMLAIYKVIYIFHMPAFILISGFFAKGFKKKGYIRKITKRFIIPYLIFQLLYSIYYYYLYDDSKFEIDLFDPQWSLWFLLSMFCWNLMLYIFTKFPAKIGLTVSFILGIAVGYVDFIDEYLSLSRTIVFFPLFLLGYYLKKEHFQKILNKKYRIVSFLTFIILFLEFYFFPNFDHEWLLGSKPYALLENNLTLSFLNRMIIYILTIVMVFSFFAFVPRKKYFFTKLGRNTIYVYLFHGFIIKFLRENDYKEFFTEPWTYVLLIFFSFAITLFFSSKFFTTIAQPFIELKATRLMEQFQKLKFYLNTHIYPKKIQN